MARCGRRGKPAAFLASTSDRGMRRSASISSRLARICGPARGRRPEHPHQCQGAPLDAPSMAASLRLPSSVRRQDARVTFRGLACDIPIGNVASDCSRIADAERGRISRQDSVRLQDRPGASIVAAMPGGRANAAEMMVAIFVMMIVELRWRSPCGLRRPTYCAGSRSLRRRAELRTNPREIGRVRTGPPPPGKGARAQLLPIDRANTIGAAASRAVPPNSFAGGTGHASAGGGQSPQPGIAACPAT
jgi:hypothetical protein